MSLYEGLTGVCKGRLGREEPIRETMSGLVIDHGTLLSVLCALLELLLDLLLDGRKLLLDAKVKVELGVHCLLGPEMSEKQVRKLYEALSAIAELRHPMFFVLERSFDYVGASNITFGILCFCCHLPLLLADGWLNA